MEHSIELTADTAKRFADDWVAAWNAHDLDKIMSHYAEDIEFASPFIRRLLSEPSGTISGKAALRDYFRKGLEAYPDLHFELLQVLAGVRSVVLYYRSVNNLLSGEMMILNSKGSVTAVFAHYDR